MATVAAKVATARAVDVEPIDRLEEKLKMLVGVIDRLRAESTHAVEENQRLSREVESLRARVAEADSTTGELTALREERELVRSRVTDMLQQIEALNL
jgi:regulator of replication initiation timing